jgi:hypothetical protein
MVIKGYRPRREGKRGRGTMSDDVGSKAMGIERREGRSSGLYQQEVRSFI